MSPADAGRVKAAWVRLALYYRQQIDDAALLMYAEDVDDLAAEDVLRAMTAARRDPRRRTVPLPAELRDHCAPREGSPTARANELAGRLVRCIARFGYTGADRARAEVGELGWRVYEQMGGYTHLCNTLTADRMGTFYAQARDGAKAMIEMGAPSESPRRELPAGGGSDGGMVPLADLLRRLPGRG